mgnify:CR=1 FL=1
MRTLIRCSNCKGRMWVGYEPAMGQQLLCRECAETLGIPFSLPEKIPKARSSRITYLDKPVEEYVREVFRD